MPQENTPALLDPFLGRVVQGYKIEEMIGKGGVGRVYLARHIEIGKRVAIKVLKEGLSQSETAIARFFREAKSVNEIRHENLIDIFSFSYNPTEREAFLLMEYLEGKPLSAIIRAEGPLDTERIGHIGLQLCSALFAAHQKEVIHRDLKSDNIFLINRAGQRDFTKILDFGLVKLHDAEDTPLTSIGVTLGTPAYMAPEQALGEVVDARADLYSLGIILYEMATRTLPFTAPNIRDVLKKQVMAPLPPPKERNPQINPALEAVIIRCLEKEKAARYASMQELGQALAEATGLTTSAYFGEALSSSRIAAALPLKAPPAAPLSPEELPLATTMQALPASPEAETASLPSMSSLAKELPSSGSFRSVKARNRLLFLGVLSLLILLPVWWFLFGRDEANPSQPAPSAPPLKPLAVSPSSAATSAPVAPSSQAQSQPESIASESKPPQSKATSKATKGEPPKEKKPAPPKDNPTPPEENDEEEKPIPVP